MSSFGDHLHLNLPKHEKKPKSTQVVLFLRFAVGT